MNKKVYELAKKIWDYHHMHHELEKADCILVLGSHDLRVAKWGARLFLERWAPMLVFSGGVAHQNDLLKTNWNRPEAEIFAATAIKMGVPEDKILVENQSTNTGENIRFTQRLLEQKNMNPEKIIVVQKPYMERRAYATFRKLWPEKNSILTSPPIPFDAYPTKEISIETVIHIMVGDVQRMKAYSQKGFQIPQEIPPAVWQAYQELVGLGYTKHLLAGSL